MRTLILFLSFFALSLRPPFLFAEEYTAGEPAGFLTVKGDSNLHAWQATTQTLRGGLTIIDEEIKSLQVSIPVKTLESNKDGLDKKMYGAMRAEEFPSVTFLLTHSVKPESLPEGMTGNVRRLTGDLTILSTTKSVDLWVTLENDEAGNLILKGSQDLDMTDFGVEPPKALLGAVKARPGITVDFHWILRKSGVAK